MKDGPSGNNFGHRESSDGEVVRGQYHVKLANGRLHKVLYSVQGDTGLLLTYQ